ncbi:MAG: type II toxin-antitoxin system VapC family toxin [Chloroflexota bacterium]|nr:type II toxin-antitoxin system VapC family toxin [Chloroflexota bacterium]
MKYLLDTDICIRHLNHRSEHVTARLKAENERDIVVCSVVRAELYFGAMKSDTPDVTMARQPAFAERFVSLPFDDAAAEHYARVRAELTRAGTPIGPNDLMIASVALANELTLVTHNTREFGRVTGLKIEDWETETT